jgi:hypothetical protein
MHLKENLKFVAVKDDQVSLVKEDASVRQMVATETNN